MLLHSINIEVAVLYHDFFVLKNKCLVTYIFYKMSTNTKSVFLINIWLFILQMRGVV